MKKLPSSVQEIADVIGRERALYLVGRLPRAYDRGHPSGQVILYVPKTLRHDHPLVGVLGFDDAHKLVRAFGGEILQPASCKDIYREYRDRSIKSMLITGARAGHIADLFEVSERHVRNIAREIPQEEFLEAATNTSPTEDR